MNRTFPLSTFAIPLALAMSCGEDSTERWLYEEGAAKAPSGEYCDGEDNDGDGSIDEGCTNCEMLYTRVRSWWLEAECVVEGQGTGHSLYPISVGSNTYYTWETAGSFLGAPVVTDKGRLGQQILVGKLNSKAFGIGHIGYHDWDGDGDLETVDELLTLADSVFTGFDATAQVNMFNVIVALNSEGNSLTVYIDQHCARDAEYCDGTDNDGDGSTDESCGCVEACDGYDNDGDGSADEEGPDNDRDSYMCDDCDDTRNRTYPGAYDVPENAIDDDCDGADSEYTYDYDTDVQPLFESYCVSCHTGAGASAGLDLTAEVSYENIVGVASTQLPTYVLVQPASTSQSYLYRKVVGTHTSIGGSGGRMPLGGPYLSLAQAGIIGTWITEGAPPSCDDADVDGWSCTDCDDGDATVFPGAPEVRGDEVDQDCDGADDLFTYGLEEDIQPLLTTYCISCHGSTVQQLGLRLDDGYTLSETLNIPSVQLPSMDLIEPGDYTVSYLYHKLAGTHRSAGGSGNRMPQGGPFFLAEILEMFQVWIDEGAPPNACNDADGDIYSCSDCNDSDATIYPGAVEIDGDGIDQDCDGVDPGGAVDTDGDGVDSTSDCDDTDATVYPGASELVDGLDNNCDGAVDEGTTAYDDDLDGYSEDGGDCNDFDSASFPGADETCDGFDNDCDGILDEDPVDGIFAYSDNDGDGWGTTPGLMVCDLSGPVSDVSGDCDDTSAAVFPGATETANGLDDDCDGLTDEGTTNYDDDGDGYSESAGDCNDASAAVHPGATETANGVDDDCDGSIDEGTTSVDDDGDGYSESAGDCNDASSAVHPGATESANGVDDDCDGTIDEGTTNYDDDADGYTETAGDCNDASSSIHPGATEVRGDGIDQDCNGSDLAYTYSYATNIQTIFTSRCTSCHSGGSPSGGLTLSSGSSYAALVNVPAGQLASMDRVEPGSPSTSYLYHKISNTQASVGGSGNRMPPSGGALTSTQISTISTWITEGAPNN